MSLITVSYQTLFSDEDITTKIKEAFGDNGLGAILITDIPDFKQMKMKLLTLSKKFGELSKDIQSSYESPGTMYAFGWSRGREKMKGGKTDTSKGSYYANPLYDEPTADEELIKKYPANYGKNIWPTQYIPTL